MSERVRDERSRSDTMVLHLKEYERPVPHTVRNAIDAFNGDNDILPSYDPIFRQVPYTQLTPENKLKLQKRMSNCMAKAISPEVAYTPIQANSFKGKQ
jgi:hypothetical protein